MTSELSFHIKFFPQIPLKQDLHDISKKDDDSRERESWSCLQKTLRRACFNQNKINKDRNRPIVDQAGQGQINIWNWKVIEQR